MGKRVRIKTEMPTEAFHERYRQTTDAVERTHWHILWLIKEGKSPQDVATMLGYTARWVRTMVQRWNAEGETGIRDRRHESIGNKPLLSVEQLAALREALQAPPADGGLWNGRHPWRSGCKSSWDDRLTSGEDGKPSDGWAIAHVSLVRSISKRTRKLKRLLKKLPEQGESVRKEHPQARVELWSMDEHRIGLKPILRRVWAPKGATVKAPVAPRSQWMDVFAFVHPQSGRTCWLLLPGVNTDIFSQALQVFAQEVGVGSGTRVVLALDRAGWHRSTQLQVPPGVHLEFLPPYSPEVQPAERLWPLSNEPLANRVFAS